MKIPVHADVPISRIELDRTNPRIRKWVEMYAGDISEDRLSLALMADSGDEGSANATTVEKLKHSIRTNGTIVTPIMLNKLPDGTLVCVEGNTRVKIYQEFSESAPDDKRWQTIPSLIYPDLSIQEIEAIRLQVHLVGPRPWEAYSKAKYLHYLRTQEHLPFETIVAYCGGRTREVEEQIAAYQDMEHYYRQVIPDDGAFDTKRFSGFVELQNKDVKRALLDANFTLLDFARWIHEGKLKPLWHIRELPRILRHPEARRVFLRENSREALKQLERPDLSKSLMDADLLQLARALSARAQKVNVGELTSIREKGGAEELMDARDSLKMLIGILKNPDLFGDGDE